jgi:hypothetical protein
VTLLTRSKAILVVGIAVLALVLALLAITIRGGPARAPLPNPNGYDDFIKASGLIVGNVGDFTTLDRDSLHNLVSSNAEPLQLVRLGLTKACEMPMDSMLTNAAGMINTLGGMKRLAQLAVAEGRLGELENRAGDAARSYTDIVRLGNEMSRGGFLITRLVGIACESIGCHAVAKILPQLSSQDARKILDTLETLDAHRVTWAEVSANEGRYARSELRKRPNPIYWVVGWWQGRQMLARSEQRHNTVVAQERLLAAELALRCYRSDKGRLPARIDDLVTNYLWEVPLDPFTGRPIIYRPQTTNWLLYSVGPDGVDDGGRPAGRAAQSTGDILFDAP